MGDISSLVAAIDFTQLTADVVTVGVAVTGVVLTMKAISIVINMVRKA